MKRQAYSILAILLVLLLLPVESYAERRVRVRGYYRNDGTYVRPHYRTYPDGNPYNNYSFPGNYNPNTGETTSGNPDTYLRNYYKKGTGTYVSPSIPSTSPSTIQAPGSSTEFLLDGRHISAEIAQLKAEIEQTNHPNETKASIELNEKFDRIFDILSRLDKRLSKLESDVKRISSLPAPARNRNAPIGLYLRKGMDKEAVLELLGTPERTRASGGWERWYYPGYSISFWNEKLDGWRGF